MSSTVLIVEDEADILLSLTLTLEFAGYRVIGSETAETALEVLGRETPDVMLLDLRLPGMDGWELLRVLQSSGKFPAARVIVCSAHASPDAAARALELGCHAYLTKPFTSNELREVLQTALAG